MKRIKSLILICIIAILVFGCGKDNKKEVEDNEYVTDKIEPQEYDKMLRNMLKMEWQMQ